MAAQYQLHRSRNAVLGGVCAGIAEYFDVDPVVVRILFVAFAVFTLGAAVVPYVILCAVIPLPRIEDEPLDVEPKEAHSAAFGNLDVCSVRDRKCRAATASALRQVGYAHIPPSPPASAGGALGQGAGRKSVADASGSNAAAEDALNADSAVCSVKDAAVSDELETVRQSWRSQPESPTWSGNTGFADVAGAHSSTRLKIAVACALVGGSILLSIGVSIVVTALIEGAIWWQCWPLILVVLGFVRIAVPGRFDRRSAMFASGACSCVLGLTLLMASLGVISWDSFGCMIERLWPLLAAYVAFVIAGIRLRNRALIITAAFFFVLFCVLGLQLCSFPGPMHEFTLVTPLGREYPVVAPFSHVV